MQHASHAKHWSTPIAARSSHVVALMISVVLAASCQAHPPSVTATASAPVTPRSSDLKAEDELRASIDADIGEPRCTDDGQCRTLAVGENACGGPLVWLAYSTVGARGDALRASASKLAALQRRRYELTGQSSTCQYTPDPGALCKAQRCVLRPPGGAVY